MNTPHISIGKLKYLIFGLYFFSCNSSKELTREFKTIRFQERLPVKEKWISQKYLLDLPKGGKIRKINVGDYFREYRIEYPDSSVIYILNDKWSGSRLNFSNRYEINIKAINRKSENDTLFLGDLQKDDKHWREIFFGEIVVGYINVKISDKEKFDRALLSLRKQK